MKVGGVKASPITILLGYILDELRWIHWSKTVDAHRGRNRPASVVEKLAGKEKKTDIVGFSSGGDFDKERKRLLEALRHGN